MGNHRRPGFSLVELLLTISIVALLVSMLLPALKATRQLSHELACKASLRSLATAVVLYHDRYNGPPVPPTAMINLPGGRSEIAQALAEFLDAPAPSMQERIRPWACPADTMKFPQTGGSYVYYPRLLYETFVLQPPRTSMRAVMQSHRRIPLFFDWFPEHGARFNVCYFDGGVDSQREAVGFAWP